MRLHCKCVDDTDVSSICLHLGFTILMCTCPCATRSAWAEPEWHTDAPEPVATLGMAWNVTICQLRVREEKKKEEKKVSS